MSAAIQRVCSLLAIGLASTAMHYGTTASLLPVLAPVVASGLGAVVGLVLSYVLTVRVLYRKPLCGRTARAFLRNASINWAANVGAVWALLASSNVPFWWAQLLGTGCGFFAGTFAHERTFRAEQS